MITGFKMDTSPQKKVAKTYCYVIYRRMIQRALTGIIYTALNAINVLGMASNLNPLVEPTVLNTVHDSVVTQWKRAGLITLKSPDRNRATLLCSFWTIHPL